MKFKDINHKINTNMKLVKEGSISEKQFVINLKQMKEQVKISNRYSRQGKIKKLKNWFLQFILRYKLNYLIKIHSKNLK